jgi:hypothetical protein
MIKKLASVALAAFPLMACGPRSAPVANVSASPPSPADEHREMCRTVMLGAMGGATQTGSAGESMANANAAYANCMNRLPVATAAPPQPAVQASPPQPAMQTYIINGKSVTCTNVPPTIVCN